MCVPKCECPRGEVRLNPDSETEEALCGAPDTSCGNYGYL